MMPDSQPSSIYQVDLEPIGRRIDIPAGMTISQAAQAAGIELVSICGGLGSCGTCRVRLISGSLTKLTPAEIVVMSTEEIQDGFRLACQATPLSDVCIHIPPESLTTPQRLQIEGQEIEISPDPPVISINISVPPPTLNDLRSDITRLKGALADLDIHTPTFNLCTLQNIPQTLREQGWCVQVALRDQRIVALLPDQSRLLGLAVDVGTTKLAAYLVDLANGNTLAKTGAMNPQIAYGEDVVSRIHYANQHPGGGRILQSRLVETLNQMIGELTEQSQVSREQIVEAVIVGNTAMHHLLAGLPVRQLGESPYVPTVSEPIEFAAQEIGLSLASGAIVYLPPNIAGYVGSDHVAMLLASQIGSIAHDHPERILVALDIGTNTEISLVHGGRILSCSCASGPAFEGAHIRDGMRAAPGAIERVQINQNQVSVHTINNSPPIGICGSGILDAIAEMLNAGVLDERGALISHKLLNQQINKKEFVLVPAEFTGHGRDLVIDQRDVHEIQLAKGAIRAGVEVLLSVAGLTYHQIQEFIIAGAFGTYLDLKSAIRTGMFPPLPVDRFRQVGNAAGLGAKWLLTSTRQRALALGMVNKIEYIELTTYPTFTDQYVDALSFNP